MNRRNYSKSLDDVDAIKVLGSSQQAVLGPVIRVLVWNILKARRKRWLADFTALSADRDLVILQEAVFNAPTDRLFSESRRCEWIMACSHLHPLSGVATGVKTGCVAQTCQYTVHGSRHTEPLTNTQKMLLETHYRVPGNTNSLLVLNMHALNFVSVAKYIDQLDQLSVVLEQHNGPVILAGDFNTWNPRRLAHFYDCAANAGLTEASMTRQSKLSQMNQHLDHVFYRGIRLDSVASLAHVNSSDHAPITLTFTVG